MRKNIKESYSEVLEILGYMDTLLINKIPKQLIEYLKENASDEYTKHINPKYELYAQELNENTKTILALINIKYWANDTHKDKLIARYNVNNYKASQEKKNVD